MQGSTLVVKVTENPIINRVAFEGNNKLTEEQVAAIFEMIKDQPRIVVVNTAVPRPWRDDNNALIAQYASLYGAYLVDWAAISQGRSEYFGPDGVHLVPAGVRAYVDAISAELSVTTEITTGQ